MLSPTTHSVTTCFFFLDATASMMAPDKMMTTTSTHTAVMVTAAACINTSGQLCLDDKCIELANLIIVYS